MHKNALLLCFEQRLARLGCSSVAVLHRSREIAEHYEDLKARALEDGLSEAEAGTRAAEQLGDPRALAERLAAAMRSSSWWGRHPFIGFFLLPSVGISLVLFLVPLLMMAAMKVFFPAAQWRVMADGGAGFVGMAAIVRASYIGSLIALTILFWRLAQRSLVGTKWSLAACCLWSVQAAFTNVGIEPHNMFVGYLARPNWSCAAIPLLCVVTIIIRQKRAIRSVVAALAVAAFFCAPAAMADEKPAVQRGWIGGEYKAVRSWSARAFLFPSPEIDYDRSFPKSIEQSQGAAIKITGLGTNTPAALAGLRKGDIIVQMEHRPVKRLSDFRRKIDESKAGTSVAFTVYRGGETVEVSVPVGKEMFRQGGNFTICFPTVVRGWRLVPDPGVSVVFAGWEPAHGLRHDLGSRREVYDESWSLWLGVFQFSLGKRVVSQINPSPSSTMSKTALAEL